MATTLITGASSGIGKELAIQFAAGGDDVVLVARSELGPTESSFGEDSGMGKLKMFSSSTMSAKAVAKAGYEGYRNNDDVVIPGWKNRLMVTSTGFLPRFATRKLVGKLQGI